MPATTNWLRGALAWLRGALASLLLVIPVGILAGVASALFLWALDAVTQTRWNHPWLLFLLPLAGALSGWIYQKFGAHAERGNDLIIDEIHQPGGGVPLRMAPLVLLGTLLSHLCGGSVGREGTAVQMGGSLADGFARRIGAAPELRRLLLLAGVGSGFAAVFGTPLAGAIFAVEVLSVRRIEPRSIIPILLASLVADLTCRACGAQHSSFAVASAPATLGLLARVVLAALAFGLVARVFAWLAHTLKARLRGWIGSPLLRPVLGGLLVIALVWLLGTRDYLGLGVSSPDPSAVTLLSAFQPGGAHPWSWALKLTFTVLTLSAGFKGGEVTPLFFIGATLGNSLATTLGAPVDLFAALGFVAIFAAATHTPLASTVMGLELFGTHHTLPIIISCLIAHLAAGTTRIYHAQRE